jgi:anti-sigma factor RsiW
MVLNDRSATMKTIRTLMFAGLAALSLGVATADAQSLVPNSGEGAYYAARNRATVTQSVPSNAQVQSGASDMDRMETGADHSATFILDHHLYGAGGVAG